MTREQDLIAGRIARLLDQGKELPEPILARLREARQKALNRQRVGQGVLALPGGLQLADTPWLSRFVMPLVLVLAVALVSQEWLEMRTETQRRMVAEMEQQKLVEQQKLAEIDAAMLQTDLPLDAYLDRDFYVWLYASPQ
jgi:hypothetical protein